MAEAKEVVDYAFKLTDAAIISATLLGPVLAVQAQKWLEKTRAINDRRNQIFRALMATRAARLAPAHVEALNAIPVDFFGRGRGLKAITDEWRIYLDVLENNSNLEGQTLSVARQTAFLNLLHKISLYLGYSFNRSELEKDVYYPEGHALIEADQEIIRRGFALLLKGEIALPMAVKEFPATADDATLTNQAALQKLLLEWLDGSRAVKVEQPSLDKLTGSAG